MALFYFVVSSNLLVIMQKNIIIPTVLDSGLYCGIRIFIDLIFIDEDFFKLKTVWAAAGTPNAVFDITSHDLKLVTDGKVVKIN